MEMEKKNLAIIILAVALAASGIGNILFAVLGGFIEVTEPEELPTTLIFGTGSGPLDADPQYLWDSASFDFAFQIWEGLYIYNFTDPSLEIIPGLATDFGTWVGNNHTVTLKQGITFHSGYRFNATSVKFTFDRLNYLCNFSGDQGETDTIYGETAISVLYMWPDGTPVLNRTEIISEYQVKFVLNRPFGVWIPLLTFTGSMMLDPTVTPADDYICDGMSGATSETISGTGPFKFDYYVAGVEARYSRNDDYRLGPAEIEAVVFSVITDPDARNTAMLNGDVHLLDAPAPGYYDLFRAESKLTFFEAGSNTITQYLGMNNVLYNNWTRYAISYAVDYDYFITNIMEGEASRLKSPIPNGIAYANDSFDAPTFNLTKAREYMVAQGYGDMGWTDTQWRQSSFITMNYTYNTDNPVRVAFSDQIIDNLDRIGIVVEDNPLEWGDYKVYLYGLGVAGYMRLSLWFIGWMPDYNDPSNFVNSLMSNVSSSNTAQINDHLLETYMEMGLSETDPVAREKIYDDLQKYTVEVLRPWVYMYTALNKDVWVDALHGYPSNPMGYNYFYPCYFE
ncbi:MAG: ABC transporter substrate-binding protein [Promethearchaeota archaeon]